MAMPVHEAAIQIAKAQAIAIRATAHNPAEAAAFSPACAIDDNPETAMNAITVTIIFFDIKISLF
jgi:hypothetical protein